MMYTLLLLLTFWAGPPCQPRRDSHGHILRNRAALRHFKVLTGFPRGRPGYVVDHVVPLCACGPDAYWNMAWQTIADAKKKDVQERAYCKALNTPPKSPIAP